ncbi:MAG TPA: FG-GAP-like repeat-containing protein [Longimicrobiaceae bacterium]
MRPVAALLCALPAFAGCTATATNPEPALHSFRKIVLSETFYAEGATYGDLNRDGVMDIVAGPYWYAGPEFTERHEYYPPKPFDPEGYSDNFFAHVYDFDDDGWNDIFIIGFPGEEASWYRNPGEAGEGHWERHLVFQGVDNESPAWLDLTGDGRPEIVCIHGSRYGYVEPDWSDPTRPWTFRPISEDGGWQKFTHGLGVGDVNGDGRLDVLDKDGWWEQPATLQEGQTWTRHAADFAEQGGAQMYVYDLDGDGDNDVVTSLHAHGYGLAWFEQVGDAGGTRFVRHEIMGDEPSDNPYGVRFAQLHAVELVDMDGDGLLDIVTGKRHWAHGSTGDVDADAPPVIYWFRTVRDGNGGVEFVPYLIDDDSGVGVQVVVGDVNADELPDVVIANKRMTAVLLHEVQYVDSAAWEAAQPQPTR